MKYVLNYLDELQKEQLPTKFDLSSNYLLRLTESKISKPTLGISFRPVIPCIQLLPALTHIDVSYQNFTDVALYDLLGTIKQNSLQKQITYFNVSGNQLSCSALQQIFELFNNSKSLDTIYFDDNLLQNSNLQFLQKYKIPGLKILSLKNCNLRKTIFQSLTQFIDKTSININLSDNELNIQNYKIIEFVNFCQKAKTQNLFIYLDNCKLSKWQIDYLQDLRNSGLRCSFEDNIGAQFNTDVDNVEFEVKI